MSVQRVQTVLETTVLFAQSVGYVSGFDLSILDLVPTHRATPEDTAEVERLGRECAAMVAGIDLYADSRATGYDDKSNELAVDVPPAMQMAFPQANAKLE